MEELKELLEGISQQLASIDMKLSVIANNSQGPMTQGRTHYYFSPPVLATTHEDEPPQS